jgi:hypothetical protein
MAEAGEIGLREIGMLGQHQVLRGDAHQRGDPAFRDQLQDPARLESPFQEVKTIRRGSSSRTACSLSSGK